MLLNTIEYIYILSKKLLKRNTNDYNDVIMYLGHIWPNGPTAEKALNFDILAVSLLLVLLNAMTHVYILSKQVLKPNTNNYNDIMMYLGHIWPNGRESKSHHKV